MMSFKKTQRPDGLYSRETWMHGRTIERQTMPSYKSAPLLLSDISERRKCLYGQRSFSTSPTETNEIYYGRVRKTLSREKSDSSDDNSDFSFPPTVQAVIQKRKTSLPPSFANEDDELSARDDRQCLQESEVKFGLGDKDDSFSNHTYENISLYKDLSESTTSCSTGKTSYSSGSHIQSLSGSFDNSEYIKPEIPVKETSTEPSCAYSIPECNCILKQKSGIKWDAISKSGDESVIEIYKEAEDPYSKPDPINHISNGYVCMDSYISMNTIPKCLKKKKYHDYENEKDWTRKDDRLYETTIREAIYDGTTETNLSTIEKIADKPRGIGTTSEIASEELKDDIIGENYIRRRSYSSLRRLSRRRDRKCLDHSLLEATLAQQEAALSDATPDYDLPIVWTPNQVTECKRDIPANEGTYMKLDNNDLSEQIVYLPNVHPKLVKYLKSATAHRQSLEEEMKNRGTNIIWPSTEDGILKLRSPSKRKCDLRLSETNAKEELTSIFQKHIRNYAADDSICASAEIFEDLSTLLERAPLVTKCTVYNERKSFTIVGDKISVDECKHQLLAVIKYLELRLRASKTYSSTKTRYMARHEIRMVFESKLLDKCRKRHESLKVDVCDNFEYVSCKGEMQAVDFAMKELYGYLRKIQGKVYQCSNLVRQLLTRFEAKNHLQQLLRNHSLVCAWRIIDDTCIIYGTSDDDMHSVKDIFDKVLVEETIHLSKGQKGLLQSKLGMEEIKTIMQKYGGNLVIEVSDITIEIACVQRSQEEVSKRLKKFLHKHEIVKTVQDLDSGMFQLLQRFCQDKIRDLKKRCKDILVEVTSFEDRLKCGFILTGKRDFCKIAVRDLENMLTNVTLFEHTLRQVGLVQFLQSEYGRGIVSALESNQKCILQFSDGSPISQNKICVCQYRGKEIVVLQEDISLVSKGLAYIPCSQSSDEMRHQVEGEMPRSLVARECMISPDTKHVNKHNFFACLPDAQPDNSEARDALKSSVELSLQEVKKRGMTTMSFTTFTSSGEFPSVEYAKTIVETLRTFLDGEKHISKLRTVMFCAKDARQASSFVQALKQKFGCKNVDVNGSIRETATSESSDLINDADSAGYCSAKEVSDLKSENDSQLPVEFNLVKENWVSVKSNAVFIPITQGQNLPAGVLQLSENSCETIRETIQTCYPYGIEPGQVVSLTIADLLCDTLFIGNIGHRSNDKEAARKMLDIVVRKVLDQCMEDEIESVAFTSIDVGIYLLAEVIFSAMRSFIGQNTFLERVDIVVDPQDRSSFLPFEAMKKQFYEVAKSSNSNIHQITDTKGDAKKGSLNYAEGCVKVDIVTGDITKETTDVVVNSIQGNLDLSIGRLAKAVYDAAGDDIQTELRTKQNLCKIRRDGLVVGGPGKMPCRYIFHIKMRGSIDGWKSIVSVCMQQAESLGITSMSFPALGTGRKGIKPHYFTKIMMKGIRRFAATNPKSLKHIRIVIFDNIMFQTILQTACAFRSKKKRSTLKGKICDMLRKESQKQPEDEETIKVYTKSDNVENVRIQLDKLCQAISLR